ncbi:MAG: hypothetical protein J6C85_00735 [Alphaproteobacteria bacterium]|nr:hypothetical protein [Alphaproteobacteria bacterium]
MQTINIIKQLNTCISDICEENIYDTQNLYHKTYEKIKNASDTLLNNAMRLSRGQQGLIKTSDKALTLTDIKALMTNIYQTMASVDFLKNKEKEIRTCILEYHINPEDILVAMPSNKIQYLNAKTLLDNL